MGGGGIVGKNSIKCAHAKNGLTFQMGDSAQRLRGALGIARAGLAWWQRARFPGKLAAYLLAVWFIGTLAVRLSPLPYTLGLSLGLAICILTLTMALEFVLNHAWRLLKVRALIKIPVYVVLGLLLAALVILGIGLFLIYGVDVLTPYRVNVFISRLPTKEASEIFNTHESIRFANKFWPGFEFIHVWALSLSGAIVLENVAQAHRGLVVWLLGIFFGLFAIVFVMLTALGR
jgi:hypothetical protein